jgi:dUTP pyrophosphatase
MTNKPELIFQKTTNCPDSISLPKYQTSLAAAFDIQSAQNVTIPRRDKAIISTGLRALIPEGYYIRIESRSGLSARLNIEKGAGIIDADYCDEWKVILYNHSDSPMHIVVGERIAQAILSPCIQAEPKWGVVPEKHPNSNRLGGFGSTGV